MSTTGQGRIKRLEASSVINATKNLVQIGIWKIIFVITMRKQVVSAYITNSNAGTVTDLRKLKWDQTKRILNAFLAIWCSKLNQECSSTDRLTILMKLLNAENTKLVNVDSATTIVWTSTQTKSMKQVPHLSTSIFKKAQEIWNLQKIQVKTKNKWYFWQTKSE